MLRPRHATALVLTFALLPLAACSPLSLPAPQSDGPSPEERIAQEAGVEVEPGLARCDFSNDDAGVPGNGTSTGAFGTLDTAEVRETAEAYEVTFTGDLLDPALLTPTSDLNFRLDLGETNPNQVMLYTEYVDGALGITGTVAAGIAFSQDTAAELTPGAFTARYPKSSPDLADFEPVTWRAGVEYSSGEAGVEPVILSCGDGREWNWLPLAGAAGEG